MAVLMEVKDLTTRFHTDEGTVYAVNGVSYTLQEGETLGVVGESGCGKSVHALSIMGLIPKPPGEIPKGEVIFRGRDLLKLPPSKQRLVRGAEIAMVFQDPMTSLNPVLTIGRQITEAIELHLNMNKEQARKRAVQLLEMVGIPGAESRLDDYPHQFSGGMRQRVMIAMGLSCDPQLLIADEPTTALDVTIQAQIVDLVQRLQDELGMAIIWITHDLGVVAGMADRVLVMYSGFIVEEGNVNDIYAHPRHPYTLGLLRSIPRLDLGRQKRLIPIDGLPPDLLEPPTHCPFAPRCSFVQDKCWQENPTLVEVTPGHKAACWVDISNVAVHVTNAQEAVEGAVS